ncbi:MAG: YciI family protein [Opitutaceae bacterium]
MSETNLSQYLLLFRESDDAPDVAPEEMQAMFATWFAWSERLVTVGKYVGGNPLTEGGKVVRGDTGESITDGPFMEAKEVLCGYFLINAESMEDACKIAGECPGLSRGMSVEVRPIMEH